VVLLPTLSSARDFRCARVWAFAAVVVRPTHCVLAHCVLAHERHAACAAVSTVSRAWPSTVGRNSEGFGAVCSPHAACAQPSWAPRSMHAAASAAPSSASCTPTLPFMCRCPLRCAMHICMRLSSALSALGRAAQWHAFTACIWSAHRCAELRCRLWTLWTMQMGGSWTSGGTTCRHA
jgi:hypothetical protein